MLKSRSAQDRVLTGQLGNVFACLRELVKCIACPQGHKRAQLRITGCKVRVGDSRDIVGIDGFGPRLELLNRFDRIVLSDCGW
jgi:hypothetical protein